MSVSVKFYESHMPYYYCYYYYILLNRMDELVRQIWEEERIPEEWKETVIIPIHKRADRDRCENYRGIALEMQLIKFC